jgi:osmotically-inducible protein OsmY
MNLGNIVSKDSMLEDTHINFNVYNKSVLMVGEVPTDDLKSYLEETVKKRAPKMSQLINEVAVMPNSSYLNRARDGVISVQIEALFLDQEVFHPAHVSVLTERAIVYLMGSVTKREAEQATNVASKAKNVKQVVKLFNYLATRPAAEIEKDKKKRKEAEKRAILEAKKAELEAAQNELQQQIYELETN